MFGGLSPGVLYGYFSRGVRKNRARQLVQYMWRLSLGVLYALEKAMYTRATSKPTESTALGEGRERGNLVVTTSKPPVAQRAGGIGIGSGTATGVGILVLVLVLLLVLVLVSAGCRFLPEQNRQTAGRRPREKPPET